MTGLTGSARGTTNHLFIFKHSFIAHQTGIIKIRHSHYIKHWWYDLPEVIINKIIYHCVQLADSTALCTWHCYRSSATQNCYWHWFPVCSATWCIVGRRSIETVEQFGLFVGFSSFQSSISSCLTAQAVQPWVPVSKTELLQDTKSTTHRNLPPQFISTSSPSGYCRCHTTPGGTRGQGLFVQRWLSWCWQLVQG